MILKRYSYFLYAVLLSALGCLPLIGESVSFNSSQLTVDAQVAAREGKMEHVPSSLLVPGEAGYEEMLTRMRDSVQKIANEYGNPPFVQLFTNDKVRATEVRDRLQMAQSKEILEKGISEMQSRESELRAELLNLETQLKTMRAEYDNLKDRTERAQKILKEM